MADGDRLCVAIRGPWAGREGHLDAPFWTTPAPLVERMLDLTRAGPGDRLIDLGCGDGRIVIAAARRGAAALGVDIDPARIAQAEAAAAGAGIGALARFRHEDLFATQLRWATIVTIYLLPHVNQLLMTRLRTELRPGSRVAGHAFSMGGWEPEAHEKVDGRDLYLWVVPGTSACPGLSDLN